MQNQQFTAKVASTWVPSDNLKSVITAICWWINYPFDQSDWTAVYYGYRGTDNEAGIWYRYPLMGTPPLEIDLAREPGADPVTIKVNATHPLPPHLQVQIETTLSIFNSFNLRTPTD